MRYTGHNLCLPHKLMYDWTGWLSEGAPFPPQTSEAILRTADLWAGDGLHLDAHRVEGDKAQILFSASPEASPAFFAGRVKGRLQHSLRQAGAPVAFSRKVSVRSLGENTRTDVEQYLARQTDRGEFADPKFRELLRRFTVVRDDVDLAEPDASASGRYWYNLHVVLVAAGRYRFGGEGILGRLRDEAFAIGTQEGFRMKRVSLMPDHIHLAIGGDIGKSPKEIGLVFQNRLADVVGCRAWEYEFYVGTFSEYEAGRIR